MRRLLAALAIGTLCAQPIDAGTRFLARTSLGGGQAAFVVVAPTLGTLNLSPATATAGSPYVGTITGNTVGSTITATSNDLTGLVVTGTTVTGTFTLPGTPTVSLTETLPGAQGNPKQTDVAFTVNAPSSGGQLDFSDPAQSGLLSIL